MIERTITLPELGLVASTRFAFGAGVGLLLADRLNDSQRRGAGWALALVGALTTIPLAIEIFGKPATRDFHEPIEKPDRRSATLVGL